LIQAIFFLIKILMMVWMSIGCVDLAWADAKVCPKATMADMERELLEKGEFEIVFFASWCASCVENLKTKTTHRRIFVASFDEVEAAAKVAAKFGFADACRFDSDIASHFGVKSLPATRWMKRSG
jgi:hypothetical protein